MGTSLFDSNNELDLENRMVTPDFTQEDIDVEYSLRPKTLEEYIGQDKAKENLAVFIQAARAGMSHLTMFCFTALRDWAKPRCPTSSPMR